MAVLIAAAGVVWMIVCLENGWKEMTRAVEAKTEIFRANHNKDPNIKETVMMYWQSLKEEVPRPWKDLAWSAILMIIGAVVFTGVTGMMIGLISSILWSLWVQSEPLRKKVREYVTA